jgi:ABC-type nickel/cobalt efflux system permease component RcnA
MTTLHLASVTIITLLGYFSVVQVFIRKRKTERKVARARVSERDGTKEISNKDRFAVLVWHDSPHLTYGETHKNIHEKKTHRRGH